MSKEAITAALSCFDDSPTKVARALGGQVRRQNVEHWARTGSVPVEYCAMLERLTNGRVRRWALRKDDWHRIWPELAGVEGAPAVPTEQEARDAA